MVELYFILGNQTQDFRCMLKLRTSNINFYICYDKTIIQFVSILIRYSHHLTVKRLNFRKLVAEPSADTKKRVFCLASCSDDHSVRLFELEA